MRIGIDVDSTLADLSGAASQFYNDQHLQQMYTPDWTDWDFEWASQRFGLSRSYMFGLMDAAWRDHEEYMNAHETPELVNSAFKELVKMGYHIDIVTSRSKATHQYVAAWLSRYQYEGLLFTPSGVSKFEMPIDVLVDDSPKFAAQAFDYPSKTLFLVDRPWNQGIPLASNSYRVGGVVEACMLVPRDNRE